MTNPDSAPESPAPPHDDTEAWRNGNEGNEGREPRLLIIDDDLDLCSLMAEYFELRGFRLEAVHDGRRGLARALAGEHDLVLLDVMMPGLDGIEVLRVLRRRSVIPVIMLTARGAPSDRVLGLDAGADDYLPKPFGPEELLARIRAVLRRAGRTWNVAPETLAAHGIRIIPSQRRAFCVSGELDLTTMEYDILEILLRAAGRAVSRDELSGVLYQRRSSPFDRVLDVHVSHLRRKLGSQGALIQTVRGVGYHFRAAGDAENANISDL